VVGEHRAGMCPGCRVCSSTAAEREKMYRGFKRFDNRSGVKSPLVAM
jgi:hypothetical protein